MRKMDYSDVEWVNPLEAWEGMKKAWKAVPPLTHKSVRAIDGIVPPYGQRYRAFELVKPEDVKVVILGQDPYPGKGHANGLAFSVHPHVKPLPKSLANIYSEYCDDLGFARPRNGDLTPWAQQGVLLLNTALTTEEGKRGAHLEQWKDFTYETIRWLSRLPGKRVWLLWGAKAQEYSPVIQEGNGWKFAANYTYESTHPSPLSANKATHSTESFKGSKPFSYACDQLDLKKEFWKLP